MLKTWIGIHSARFGTIIPVLPSNKYKIAAVVVATVKAGYRSIDNYLSRIKDNHVVNGHAVDQSVLREIHRATLAAKRGAGPAHQSKELPTREASQWLENNQAGGTTVGSPLEVVNFLVLSSFFLLREIEASTALFKNMVISLANKTVELF